MLFHPPLLCDLSPLHSGIIRTLTQDFDLTLSAIAKCGPEHPIFKHIDDQTMEVGAVDGTLATLIDSEKLRDEISNFMHAENLPLLGSSAKLSGTGK